jgi:hypothetical protein
MNIRMKNLEALTLEEMEEFVKTNHKVSFEPGEREARYRFVERVLQGHHYRKLNRNERGTIRQFLAKVTCFRRAQRNRLIGQGRVFRGGTQQRMRHCWRPLTQHTRIFRVRRCGTS